ncbi:vacuolar cation/proton exchanger 5 [Citrus sinensis]|uniref:Vacuolar cation/proton exchanger 5 n=1 Tax=Citrus sinensis TaxID=2711 RepID=A0ACB8P266_CITSI|nr:vacuolar cation/proton exchanger 5 [Citrus sinensis]
MDVKLQLEGAESNLEMGSLGDRSMHEFEDDSLFTPEAESEKIQRVHGLQNGSVSGDFPSSGNKILQNSVCRSIKTVVFSNKLNLLMPFGPLAIMVHNLTGHKGWVFFLSLLGITPLAERLGYATEQLTFFTGATVGGLLNATFGNATELIISIYALKSGLLLMAVMGLVFPAVLHYTHTEVHFGKSELALSRFSSCIMLVAYGAYLFFQLRGQTELYVPLSEDENQTGNDADHGGNHDDNEAPEISKWESLIWLAIMTAWISILSQYVVDAIEGASASWNIPISFISVILLPIVGNAAEHASAIMFAMKDKLDISLGVAIGSSTQISMFGIPFCVVIGWIMGRPMDLNFQLFETATLFITVIVVAFFLQEGTSNYFKGLMLILCYLIVAASFFVHEDPTPGGVIGAGVLSLAWSMAQLGWIADFLILKLARTESDPSRKL